MEEKKIEVFKDCGCDKLDYMLAVTCGVMAGVMDVTLVGEPGASKLQDKIHGTTEEIACRITGLMQSVEQGGKDILGLPDNTKCLKFLYEKFKKIDGIDMVKGNLGEMLDLIAEKGDGPLAAMISIVRGIKMPEDAAFAGKDKHIILAKNENGFMLKGRNTNLGAMVFCALVNFICKTAPKLRDAAQAMNLEQQLPDIAKPVIRLLKNKFSENFDPEQFMNTMMEVFEKGYDTDMMMAAAVPVVVQDVLIRTCWFIRHGFENGKPVKDCLPTEKHSSLRMMLIVGAGTIEFIDIGDAALNAAKNHDMVSFVCRLNLVGLARLSMLVIKEVLIRTGAVNVDDDIFDKIFGKIPEEDKKKIAELAAQIQAWAGQLSLVNNLKKAVNAVEGYKEAHEERLKIEQECMEAVAELSRQRAQFELAFTDYMSKYLTAFSEALDDMDAAQTSGDVDRYIAGTVKIEETLGRDAQFKNSKEFDDIMNSDDDFVF